MRMVVLGLICIAIISCEKDKDPVTNQSDFLVGYWANPENIDTLVKYTRSTELEEDDYGFGFKAGGTFVERKNAGWCGTPPITYGDFEGTWIRNGSLINITVGYWGGTAEYRWKIIEIDDNRLMIYWVAANYKYE